MRRLLPVLLGLLPGLAGAQKMKGVTEVATDTVRRGVFFELGGPGELYSLAYESHLRPQTITQIGFTRWSSQFLTPRHATRAGILTVFRQVSAPDVFSEYAFAEFGGGIVGGLHFSEENDPGDPIGRTVIRTNASWLAVTGLVGLRFQPINGGLTFRLGWTPMIVLSDLPRDKRWSRMNTGFSIGYTW